MHLLGSFGVTWMSYFIGCNISLFLSMCCTEEGFGDLLHDIFLLITLFLVIFRLW